MKLFWLIPFVLAAFAAPGEAATTCTKDSSPFDCYQAGLEQNAEQMARLEKMADEMEAQLQAIRAELALPKGAAILFIDKCPDNWRAVSAAENRYLRVATTNLAPTGGALEVTLEGNNIPRIPVNIGGGEKMDFSLHASATYRPQVGSFVGLGGGIGSIAEYRFDELWAGMANPHPVRIEPPYFRIVLCQQ
jgi:hypothetical protein